MKSTYKDDICASCGNGDGKKLLSLFRTSIDDNDILCFIYNKEYDMTHGCKRWKSFKHLMKEKSI
jgi:hypothetical protein